MNNNQQFDEHIKEQFSSYAPDVHPRIWENIIAEKERRKPVGFWFTLFNNRNGLLLLSLLLAGGIGAWLIIRNASAPVSTQVAIEKNKATDNDQPELNKNALPGNDNVSEPGNTSAILNKDNNTAAANDPSANTNTSLSVPGGTKASIYKPSPLTDNEQSILSNKKPGSKKRYSESGNVNINTESPGLADDDLTGQGTLLGRLTYNAQRISADPKTKKQLPLTFNPIIFLPGCPSIEDDAAGNKKYFEIYGGPDFAFRSLSDTGNSVYLQKRKESAKFSSAYSAGLRYTKVFNNSMSIRGGVNYSQINEKFTFVQGNLIQVTYIIDANGDTTGSYITTGTRYKTTINKYRSIDIPIMIGYELGNGKLHANINAGVVVNIYSWQKGDVLDYSLQPVDITTGKSSSPYQFKTNAGVGFMGAVSVYYKLNDKIHLMAEPYFRYNFSPMNKDNITLKQKYQTLGLRLGIRLDIK